MKPFLFLLLCLSLGGIAEAQGEGITPPSPMMGRLLRERAGLPAEKVLARASRSNVTHFKPSGERLTLAKIAASMTEDTEKQKTLIGIFEKGLAAYEAGAQKSGKADDVAPALAFFVGVQWSVYHDGKVPSDQSMEAMAQQFRTALDHPDVSRTRDADKQAMYEWAIATASFSATLYQGAKEQKSATTLANARKGAGQFLKSLLRVEPETLDITDAGLKFGGTAPEEASITPVSMTIPASKAAITYTMPSGWQKEAEKEGTLVLFHGPGTSDSDRDRFYRLVVLRAVPKQGDMSKTYRRLWDEVVDPLFVPYNGKAFQPMPLLTRLPNGLVVAFDGGELMNQRRGAAGKSFRVFLYVIDAGDQVIPLMGVEHYGQYGGSSREKENVAGFFASVRVSGYTPPTNRAPAVDSASLVGTWESSHWNSADYVTASGSYGGDASSGYLSTLTLKPDGTFQQTVLTRVNGSNNSPARITGRWKLDGSTLRLYDKKVTGSANNEDVTFKLLGVGPSPNGKSTVMVYDSRGVSLVFESREAFGIWVKK